MADKVRIDKYLWAIRIFKSRSISTEACKSGRVRIREAVVKPSTHVVEGDIINVVKDGFRLEYKVITLIEKRVSFVLAKPCYEDLTPAEEINKYKSWFVGKASSEQRERGAGRPTKRERRNIDDFKQYYEGED
jgi:ribosome-associated heat shock protein Hsp15